MAPHLLIPMPRHRSFFNHQIVVHNDAYDKVSSKCRCFHETICWFWNKRDSFWTNKGDFPTIHTFTRRPILKIRDMLPTVVTMGNIICGFSSILCASNHRFEIAAWLIVAAMALDAFDGRLARMMKSSSKIGAQLDSMADLTTFGIAPAILMIKTCTDFPIVLLWGTGLFYMICAAFRLARFNIQKDEETNTSRHFFAGLPTTLSGGTIAQLVILNNFIQMKFGAGIVAALLPFITLALGLFMVSKIPFFNITGKIGIKQGVWFMVLEFSAAILFFVITPELALSTALSCYLITCAMYGVVKGKRLKKGYSVT